MTEDSTAPNSKADSEGRQAAPDDAADSDAVGARPEATHNLRRTRWMRKDPVEKWTMLLDIGRRGVQLLESPSHFCNVESRDAKRLSDAGGRPLKGPAPLTEAERQCAARVCAGIKYPMRLRLVLSLAMWARGLRDVQDTLARVRLPYAHVESFRGTALAHVFPTRLQEYWADPYTTVTLKMSRTLNPAAEQVPAPHTWDVETAVTIDDPVLEQTFAVEHTRHGARGQRESPQEQLRRVQGLQPRRSSEDDEREAAVGARAPQHQQLSSGRRRRRLALGHGSTSGGGGGAVARRQPDANSLAATSLRQDPAWALRDARRAAPPVTLGPSGEAEEDARYHGNAARGEGCPLEDETGASTAAPVHVPLRDGSLLLTCVLAHAAVLSCLFVEGRVARFTTDTQLVADYVAFVFGEALRERFLSVAVVPPEEPGRPRRRIPYYPLWSTRSVTVLLPPRGERYTARQAREIARTIAAGAPCDVLVLKPRCDPSAETEEEPHVRQVREALAQLRTTEEWDSASLAVKFVPIAALPRQATKRAESCNTDGAPETPRFVPKGVSVEVASRSFTPPPAAPPGTGDERDRAYLTAVSEVLEMFYCARVVYCRENCRYRRRELRAWVWEGMPSNTRLVGLNASPLAALYFFPQAAVLGHKVGNAMRYRAVERSVIVKRDVATTFASHPLRRLLEAVCGRRRAWCQRGLHPELSAADRRRVAAGKDSESADAALRCERTIEYLTEPSRLTLLALVSAIVLGL